MLIKDKLLDVFSKAPSKNKETIWDDVFLIDKTPPEWFPLRKRKIKEKRKKEKKVSY